VFGAEVGVLFVLVAAVISGCTDNGIIAVLRSLSEGFIIGGLVGSCAGVVSSLIGRRMPHLRPGQLAAAGGGVSVGAFISLAGILIAAQFSAISEGPVGISVLSWLALPVANAALDFVSLGCSHVIGRYVVRHGESIGRIIACLAMDLALAVLFMVITVLDVGLTLDAVTMGLGVETPSGSFLAMSASDPWDHGLWLTLMALTTTVWTWLHFAFVIAPLAAAALVGGTVERAAAQRLQSVQEEDAFDLSVPVLISVRPILFYGVWGTIAALPVLFLLWSPNPMALHSAPGLRLSEGISG